MSAESDNLETLSNKELYHRMTELGLPSIPVTDTTRKLLIKRIRHHVTEAKAKTRRETVAVVKYSSDEEPEAPKEKPKKAEVNRRATLAAPVAPKVIEEKPKPPPSRRSGRITPTPVGVAPPPVVAPTVYEIIEDSDEEPEILTQRPPRRSKSKSPSLSRSDVVTTSYKQVIESVKESVEEEEEEAEDEAPELPTRFTQLNYRPPSVPRPPSSLSRRSLGGYSSLNSPSTSYTTYAGRYSSLGTRKRDEDVDTPYLSDFTRNLLESHRVDAGSSHFRADSSTTAKGESIADSIVAVFNALDRKFSLKRNLIILSVVLLIILVFVFFLY